MTIKVAGASRVQEDPMNQRMVTLQAWRLEMDDGEHFKQYTGFCGDGFAFFGFAAIDVRTWQWLVKPRGADAARVVAKQLDSKRRKGYEDVWRGDVTIPELWALDPKAYRFEIRDFVEDARSGAATSVPSEPGQPADAETPVATHLSGLLADARRTVSKMAVEPDTAMADYAALIGQAEAAREDLDVVDGYIGTLKIMLAGGEAKTA